MNILVMFLTETERRYKVDQSDSFVYVLGL
jgi:hypothetical protein